MYKTLSLKNPGKPQENKSLAALATQEADTKAVGMNTEVLVLGGFLLPDRHLPYSDKAFNCL